VLDLNSSHNVIDYLLVSFPAYLTVEIHERNQVLHESIIESPVMDHIKHRGVLVSGEVKGIQCNVVAAKSSAIMKPSFGRSRLFPQKVV